MRKVLSISWHYLRAFALIYLCLYAGTAIAARLPFTLPGSIVGMLLLFCLLTLQIIPAGWVRPGCHLIIRYMALLFVPISVGIMSYTDVLMAQFGPIVVSCTVSTLLVLLVVGVSSQKLQQRSDTRGSEHE